MKYVLSLALCASVSSTYGQVLPRTQVISLLNSAVQNDINYTSDPSHLVSQYAFRKLFRNDFSRLLTGEENKTKVGKYASLEVDKEQKTFSLTPIAWSPGNNSLTSDLKYIVALDLEGSVTGKGIFDWEERTKAKASISFTRIWGGFFFPKKNKPSQTLYHQVYQQVADRLIDEYDNSGKNVLDSLSISDTYTNAQKLLGSYSEKVSESQEIFTRESWGPKRFIWIKFTPTFLSYDVFSIVSASDTASSSTPIDRTVYNPSVEFSLNGYVMSKHRGSFYASTWIRIGKKHTLSEIGTTTEWNKITRFSDTTFLKADNKDVYVLQSSIIETKILPDVGIEAIYFLPDNFLVGSLGIDLIVSRLGILSPDDGDGSVVTKSIGLIFPLKDKDGKNTINIVPYYEHKQFRNYPKANKEFIGIKFSLPFKNVLN